MNNILGTDSGTQNWNQKWNQNWNQNWTPGTNSGNRNWDQKWNRNWNQNWTPSSTKRDPERFRSNPAGRFQKHPPKVSTHKKRFRKGARPLRHVVGCHGFLRPHGAVADTPPLAIPQRPHPRQHFSKHTSSNKRALSHGLAAHRHSRVQLYVTRPWSAL